MMNAQRISVDEGGLRHEASGTKQYVPFASIADVELKTRLLREPAVAIARTGATSEEFVVFAGPDALEIHGELVKHLASRRSHAAATSPAWRRNGRSLAEWFAAVAVAPGGYRDNVAANALALAEDADADIEVRAAAVHLLVRSTEESDLVRIAKLLSGRAMPPLVQVAAYLAPGGTAFVSPDSFAEATSFLDPSDRAALSGLRGEDAPKTHVVAAQRAKLELHEEARRHTSSPAAGRALRAGVVMSDRDTSRWIGRSWGL